MASLLTRRELADLAGVSRQAVEKALARERLHEEEGPDGRLGFNPEAEEVRLYITSAKKPRRVAQRARGLAPEAHPAAPPPPAEPASSTPPSTPLGGDLPLGNPNALDALKTAAQIESLRLGTELKRERYIERALVVRFFSWMLAIDEGETKTLGDRLGSLLASEARRAPTEDEAAIACGRIVSEAALKTLEHRRRRLREIRAELKAESEGGANE